MNNTARNGRRITGKLNQNDTLEAMISPKLKQLNSLKSSEKVAVKYKYHNLWESKLTPKIMLCLRVELARSCALGVVST